AFSGGKVQRGYPAHCLPGKLACIWRRRIGCERRRISMRNHGSAKVPWSRPLGDLLQPVIGPLLAKRGFGQGALILYWDSIVGERLAPLSRPVKVQWPPCPRGSREGSARNGAALVVRVETGFALEMQHLAPIIIERANAHFGWQCISRLVLMQGPV